MKIEHKPLDWFKPNPENYREHPAEQIEQLAVSMRQAGCMQPIVARADGTVIDGHGRIEAALQLGIDSLPVFIYHGDDNDSRHLLLALNLLQEMARDDPDRIRQLYEAMSSAGDDLAGTGMSMFADILSAYEEYDQPVEVVDYAPDMAGLGTEPGPALAGMARKAKHVRFVCGDLQFGLTKDLYSRLLAYLHDKPTAEAFTELLARGIGECST